ncbi:MAG: element excision factor XisI family protein [Blastocatellia bacterium]
MVGAWSNHLLILDVEPHPVVSNGKESVQARHKVDCPYPARREDIPKSDIVLGFQPPHVRSYTEYAVA